jgi:hypothetical protein
MKMNHLIATLVDPSCSEGSVRYVFKKAKIKHGISVENR